MRLAEGLEPRIAPERREYRIDSDETRPEGLLLDGAVEPVECFVVLPEQLVDAANGVAA